jgi:hypothetical protein
MHMSDGFHWPPEALDLIVSAIAKLIRGRQGVIDFFRGANVPLPILGQAISAHRDDPKMAKAKIARIVLVALNDAGDARAAHTARNEIVRRVVQWDDFTTAWPDDQLEAEGLVARIRSLVDKKDSFTRMKEERDRERRQNQEEHEKKAKAVRLKTEQIRLCKKDFYALFGETNPWRRGKALESVLNRLFKAYGIGLRDAFTIRGTQAEGVVEQVDGVIELVNIPYVVEIKWHTEAIGAEHLAQHLVRVFRRMSKRGIFFSASGFTAPAVTACRDWKAHGGMCVLAELEELVYVLDNDIDLATYLNAKVFEMDQADNPLFRPSRS